MLQEVWNFLLLFFEGGFLQFCNYGLGRRDCVLPKVFFCFVLCVCVVKGGGGGGGGQFYPGLNSVVYICKKKVQQQIR